MNLTTLTIKLSEEYPTQTEKIQKIKPLIESIENGNNITENIETLQQICNDLYRTKYTENILNLQVIINEYRHKFNVTDPREIRQINNEEDFVQ